MKARRFDFYCDDWIAGTVALSMDERGVYITAIALMYSHGGRVLKTELRRHCQCDLRVYKRVMQTLVSTKKIIEKGDYLTNKRVATETQKMRNRGVNAVENGRKGGRPRKENNELDKPKKKLPSPSPSPSPLKKERERERGGALGSLSEDFPENWIAEGAAARVEAGLPAINLLVERATFLLRAKTTGPPTREAWLKWVLNARHQAPLPNGKDHDEPQRSRPRGPPPKPAEIWGVERG